MAITLNGTTGITTPGLIADSPTLTVDSANNRVGVGTTITSSVLHIYGGNNNNYADGIIMHKVGGNMYGIYPSTNNLEFRSVTGNTHIATFDYNGNVGIGTETPTGLLHLNNSNASSYTTLRISNSGASGRIFEIGVGGNTAASTSYQNKLYIYDSTAGQPRVALDSSGNFGLGTLSPDKKFHVWESTGSNLFRLNGYNSYNLDISNTNDNGATYDFAIGSGAAQFSFSGSSGELLRITSAGNLKFASSGSGIDFSATADGSGTTTSELLDDYEEGTWTPEYAPSSGSFTSITYATQSGTYIKIGRAVYCHLDLATSSLNVTGASGNVRITGLPFNPQANARVYAAQNNNWASNNPNCAVTTTSGQLEVGYNNAVNNTFNVISDLTTVTATRNEFHADFVYYVS